MNEVNRIINESGISKVNVAKFLGVSRQMLYNYLALSSTDELPKDKQNKFSFVNYITVHFLFNLFIWDVSICEKLLR